MNHSASTPATPQRSSFTIAGRRASALLAVLALLAACDTESSAGVTDAVTVAVSPDSASLSAGGTQTFASAVANATNTSVIWSVQEGAGGGSITSTGAYTAPSAAGTYHVVATSVAAPSVRGTAAVTVQAPGGGAYALPADRATAWKPGLNGVGGIPSASWPTCATVSPSGGDDSAAIQAAVDACPVGRVVQLSAGTFNVNSRYIGLTKGVVLRGAGAGVTFLRKTNGAQPLQPSAQDPQPVVIIGPNRWPSADDATSQNLTADGAKGAFSVTVANASGFAPGQIVLLDELSGASWQTDRLGRGQIWASPDWRVVWQFHNPPQGYDDPLVATTPTSGGAASWFSRQDRVTAETKEVASVSGNVVTFTTPLHISYRTSHTAQLTRYTGSNAHVKNAGLESLTVSGGGDGAVRFECAAYSWMKNVENTVWLGEGVAVNRSFRIEVRDSYLHDGAWSQPGGGGYAISLAHGSAEVLFENNISIMANKVMVARCAGAGSVFGYNYVDDGFILGSESWIEVGLNASHMVGPHHVLFEGNYGFNFDSDHTHGNSVYHTIFRNWLRGVRKPFVNPMTGHAIDDQNQSGNGTKRCAGALAYSYWMSFVGNVLGAQGQMSGWSYDFTGPGGISHASIWLLGWDEVSPYPYDAEVAATTIRDGNWDWVQAKQSWHNSAAGTLPSSLYLSAKPAFFGANPWPWVDPTTGTLHTLPAKARFEAGTPNLVP